MSAILKPTPEELKVILEAHGKWVRTRWDDKPEGTRANLYGANLYGANLYGANLYGANLYGANLYGANLYGANLYGANLYGANLYGANLYGANLYGANLTGANLTGANLTGANLTGANLTGANLTGANLTGANLTGANLTGANLTGANLTGANLTGANLTGANLTGANLTGANLPAFGLCPEEGHFVGWKKVRVKGGGAAVLKLRIEEGSARVSSLVGRKCRASEVTPIAAYTVEGKELDPATEFCSTHNHAFTYQVGRVASVDDCDTDIRVECTRGIHFFMTRREAEQY